MTRRERKLVTWLADFMEDQLGAVEYRPTIRRMESSKRMLLRWLDEDTRKYPCGKGHGASSCILKARHLGPCSSDGMPNGRCTACGGPIDENYECRCG